MDAGGGERGGSSPLLHANGFAIFVAAARLFYKGDVRCEGSNFLENFGCRNLFTV